METQAGVPIIKIGYTSRDPLSRLKELQTGSPSRLSLVGFVAAEEAKELERDAHRHFASCRVRSGGSEYFAAEPETVLAWLRKRTLAHSDEIAREYAWRELVNSKAWKRKSLIGAVAGQLFVISIIILFFYGFSAWLSIGIPVILAFIYGRTVGIWIAKRYTPQIEAEKIKIAHKYGIPVSDVKYV